MGYSLEFVEPFQLERNYTLLYVTCKVLIIPDSPTVNPSQMVAAALLDLKEQMADELPIRRDGMDGMMRVIHEGETSTGESIFWCKDDFSGPIETDNYDLSSLFYCIYISDPHLSTFRDGRE